MSSRRASAGAALLAAGAIAGCGSAASNGEQSKPAATILSDARAAASGAKTVHVVGSSAQASIDLRIVSGKGATGSVTQSGSTFQLIRTGDVVYIQAPPQFYVRHGAPAAVVQLLKGRWLKTSASRPDVAAFVALTDLSQLFPLILKGKPAKDGQTTVAGTKAITLIDPLNGARLDVSLSGKPYPLELGGPGAHYRFNDWNKSVSLKAPAGAIDMSRQG